jgi:hypothetical protein
MNRRSMLAGLVGLPFVQGAKEIKPGTRAIILTLREGVDDSRDELLRGKESVKKALRDAGCGDVPVIFLKGLDAVTVEGDAPCSPN